MRDFSSSPKASSRTPRGVRGLKFLLRLLGESFASRTPRGVRGLKSSGVRLDRAINRRTPRGVRGLKYCRGKINPSAAGSHPSRGAWIEIVRPLYHLTSL